MKVLMTSTSYPADPDDWKGLFIRNMVDALSRRDDVDLALWAPPGLVPKNVTVETTKSDEAFLGKLMRAGGVAHLIRTRKVFAGIAIAGLLRRLNGLFRRSNADIFHINWLQNSLPLPRNRTPVLVTVLGTDMQLLRLPLVARLIRRSLHSRSAAICPNAEWMCTELRDRFGDIATIRPVVFGIGPEWYRIHRDVSASMDPLWLVVTRLTRKKLGPLFEYCAPLFAGYPRQLHLFGPMQESIEIPDWVNYHGAVASKELATDWFPKAHGLITVSEHAEGRPQVMLEAMASGLPIVASKIPAHGNLLDDDETGILVGDKEAFAAAITKMEDSGENRRVGEAARVAVRKSAGTWDDCARRYVEVYRELLETKSMRVSGRFATLRQKI